MRRKKAGEAVKTEYIPLPMPAVAEQEAIMQLLMAMGENALMCGAEVHRVEDMLTRIAEAYAVTEANVFVITSNITITLVFGGSRSFTRTCRILKQGDTDFTLLETLNGLSREICARPLPPAEVIRRVREAAEHKQPLWERIAASLLVAVSLSLFYGGTPAEAAAAGLFSLFIVFLQRRFSPFCMNTVIFNLLSALAVGGSIYLTVRILPGLNAGRIIMGDIMLLIPGIALTNAVRDMFLGDTISGAMRLIEALIWAGALACGFMAAMLLLGG